MGPDDSDVPVFRSDDIKNTLSSEAKTASSGVTSTIVSKDKATLRAEKRAQSLKKRELSQAKIAESRQKVLEKLKKNKSKILIISVAALAVILLTIFLPTFLQKQATMKEADKLIEETKGFIAFFKEKYPNSYGPNDEPEETETNESDEGYIGEDEVDDDSEYEEGDFSTIYDGITDWLNSSNSFHNDEINLKLAKSLMDLSFAFYNITFYESTIDTLNTLYPRIESDNIKAEISMMLAEAYYICDQKVEAFEQYSRAANLNPEIIKPDYYKEKTNSFVEMWQYCQRRATE